jgi:hypothetical protein
MEFWNLTLENHANGRENPQELMEKILRNVTCPPDMIKAAFKFMDFN